MFNQDTVEFMHDKFSKEEILSLLLGRSIKKDHNGGGHTEDGIKRYRIVETVLFEKILFVGEKDWSDWTETL